MGNNVNELKQWTVNMILFFIYLFVGGIAISGVLTIIVDSTYFKRNASSDMIIAASIFGLLGTVLIILVKIYMRTYLNRILGVKKVEKKLAYREKLYKE